MNIQIHTIEPTKVGMNMDFKKEFPLFWCDVVVVVVLAMVLVVVVFWLWLWGDGSGCCGGVLVLMKLVVLWRLRWWSWSLW